MQELRKLEEAEKQQSEINSLKKQLNKKMSNSNYFIILSFSIEIYPDKFI